MAMTPAKKHATRAKYEALAQARKNDRLGFKPMKSTKKGKKK